MQFGLFALSFLLGVAFSHAEEEGVWIPVRMTDFVAKGDFELRETPTGKEFVAKEDVPPRTAVVWSPGIIYAEMHSCTLFDRASEPETFDDRILQSYVKCIGLENVDCSIPKGSYKIKEKCQILVPKDKVDQARSEYTTMQINLQNGPYNFQLLYDVVYDEDPGKI